MFALDIDETAVPGLESGKTFPNDRVGMVNSCGRIGGRSTVVKPDFHGARGILRALLPRLTTTPVFSFNAPPSRLANLYIKFALIIHRVLVDFISP